MRRSLPLVLFLALLAPAVAEAQPRFLVSGGFSSPTGNLSDDADTGFHGQVGLYVQIPTLPIGLRGDGAVHELGSSTSGIEDTQILAGALSLVYNLPGVGLAPYLLAGVGTYQTKAGLVGATEKVTDTGYHGGFGVNLGTGGLGAFAEIRFVRISGGPSTSNLIPMTFGLRL